MSAFRCLSVLWLVASAVAFVATAVAAVERAAAASWIDAGATALTLPEATALKPWCRRDGERLVVADVDGDGREDLTCQSAAGDVRVLLASLAAGGANEAAIWRRRWCPPAEARLVWIDVDHDGRADAVCLRANGNHAALRSVDGALQAAGERADGRLIEGWCPGAAVSARIASVHGDGRLGLQCDGFDGEVRLPTWSVPDLDRSDPDTVASSGMVAIDIDHRRTGLARALLGIPLLLFALGAIPVLRRRPSSLRTCFVALLLVFAAGYPERVAQTAVEKPSEYPLPQVSELQSARPDVVRTRSWLACENAMTLRDR